MWLARSLLLFLCLSGVATPGSSLQDRVVFSNITQSHGMPPGGIRAQLQDRKGNHWMATAAGLTKFDGIELTHYQAADGAAAQVPKNVVALAEDVDNTLWLGSDGQGLCRFQPGWGILERFGTSSGLAHDCVTSLQAEEGGSLWIGTRAGLNWMDRQTFQIQAVRVQSETGLEEILGLQLSPNGTLWTAVARRGIFRKADGGPWVMAWKSRSAEMQMALAPDGDLWAYLEEEGLLELSGSGTDVRLHEMPHSVRDATGAVLAIEADAFGDVWLGTGRGLLKYVAADGRWSSFEHQERVTGSLVPGRITSLLADRRSLLWAGSDQGELSWHALTRYWFPSYSAGPGGLYSNDVNGFAPAHDGGVWIATSKGLNRFEPSTGEITRIALQDGDRAGTFREVLCVLEDRSGRLWVGTRKHGLAMRAAEAGSFRFFQPSPAQSGSLPDGSVVALFEDYRGEIWAAVTGNGIVRYSPENGGTFRRLLPAGGGAEMLFVNDFESDGARGAWLSTVGGGLWHLDLESEQLQPLASRVPLKQPLPSNNLFDVLRSRDGDLWIGTFGGGLARLNTETGLLEKFDRWEGRLPDWSACGLVEDHDGKIWVSTSKGLLRIDPTQGGVRRFGIRDGLQSRSFHSRSARRLVDGRLLFGGSAGFNLIDPRRLPAELPPPRPLLAGLELNGEPVKPSSDGGLLQKPLALTSELRIPFDPRMRFALRYGTVFFADEGQVWFRFQMHPLDVQWQAGTLDRKATYQGLEPGNYQFVVQTSRDGHHWDGATSSIRVAILPPWYQTRWASLLGLLLFGTLVASLGKSYHSRRLAKQRAERERLESERNQAEAALARQLQHSMLVEQSVTDFHKRLNPNAIFEGTLERLTQHLRLSRCLLYAKPEQASESVLAEYVKEGVERVAHKVMQAGWQNLESLLGNEGAVTLQRAETGADEAAQQNWERFWGPEVESVLAVRTICEERPNGILVLEVCGARREWNADERRLVEAIANHLGLVLAQLELREREAKYRRELEEARSRADAANKAKGEFLAKMTHELRTPLSAIIGFSEMLDRQSTADPEQRQALELIDTSADHLLGVINEVLELSKLEAGGAEIALEETEFSTVLRAVHGMLSIKASRKRLRFELVPLSELPAYIETDKAKLQQILVNLLSNSVKFTEAGGVFLRVSARPRLATSGEHPKGRRPLELIFEVLDTGPGISREELPRLFRDFSQTRTGKERGSKEGSGLGLAIAKGYSELLGGRIDVVSQLGTGTLFTVKLPVWEILKEAGNPAGPGKPDMETVEAEAASIQVPRGIRVLVVEDHPINRVLLRKVLLKVGCILEEAENGAIAVEKAQSFRPDIILMDECMPVMTGTEATKEILARSSPAARPVIISLTANAMAEQRDTALAAGCADFLPKPFKQKQLYAKLAQHAPQNGNVRKAA